MGAGINVRSRTERRASCRSAGSGHPLFFGLFDMTYLSSYGCPVIKTPAIDAIGERGVRFTQFYSNSSQCTPSRVALLTGRYQHTDVFVDRAIEWVSRPRERPFFFLYLPFMTPHSPFQGPGDGPLPADSPRDGARPTGHPTFMPP